MEENNIVLSRTQRMKDFVKSWALPVICFVVFWLIFKFVLMTSIIPTQSMYPTLSAPCFTVGVRTDVLNKSYERGDIVLFQRDDGNERFYAKRIVGMPLRYNYDKPEKPRISRVFGYLARFFILFQTEKSSREVVIS